MPRSGMRMLLQITGDGKLKKKSRSGLGHVSEGIVGMWESWQWLGWVSQIKLDKKCCLQDTEHREWWGTKYYSKVCPEQALRCRGAGIEFWPCSWSADRWKISIAGCKYEPVLWEDSEIQVIESSCFAKSWMRWNHPALFLEVVSNNPWVH